MKLIRSSFIFFILILFHVGYGYTQETGSSLQLPYVFTDHMVIQRDKPIKIWGEAFPDSKIKVELFGSSQKTVADENGSWLTQFPPMKSGAPGSLIIKSGKEKIEIKDILIGEVWLCAGQSNMYWPLKSSDNAELEILKSDYPDIRLLDMQAPAWPGGGKFNDNQLKRHYPDKYYEGKWELCSPETSGKFSAVAYHFGRELHDSLGVPIGLIDVAVGGVTTESFISIEALSNHPDLKNLLNNWFENPLIHPWVKARTRENLSLWFDNPKEPRPRHPFEPGMLYESGIEPILPFSIKGAIWYQGESNLPTATDYYPVPAKQNEKLFHLLINSWRKAFNQGNFPFYYVQLPNINRDWAEYRDMQRKTLDEVPNTGMAITIDIGNPDNVHPTNKRDVGHRMAIWALSETYNKDIIPYSGPLPAKVETSGKKVKIEFEHAQNGFKNSESQLSGFEIAGMDGRFVEAEATLQDNNIILSSKLVDSPVSVRYAWSPNPTPSLFNKEGLPASPFQIDLTDAKPDVPSFIDVFTAGKDEIEGILNAPGRFAQYREQNIVITNNGTVVAVCQAREKSSWSDRSGQDLVVKTSKDNGYRWSRSKLIAIHGNHSIVPNAAIYDRIKDKIHVLYNVTEWDYSRPPERIKGEMHDDKCRQYVITSDDNGETWTPPRDISEMIDTDGAVAVFGSGEGIQLTKGLHKGRLIVTGGDFNKGKIILAFYSDDHGETWLRGEPVPLQGDPAMASETKLVELPDGTLILNSRTFIRNETDQRLRSKAFSKDGGITWSTLENDPDLKTVSCNAALLGVSNPKGKEGMILLNSLPAGPGRTNGTIYISFDGGLTWPYKRIIIEEQFAYSSLVQFADGYIGLFYEARGHKDIKLVRFNVEWLLGD